MKLIKNLGIFGALAITFITTLTPWMILRGTQTIYGYSILTGIVFALSMVLAIFIALRNYHELLAYICLSVACIAILYWNSTINAWKDLNSLERALNHPNPAPIAETGIGFYLAWIGMVILFATIIYKNRVENEKGLAM